MAVNGRSPSSRKDDFYFVISLVRVGLIYNDAHKMGQLTIFMKYG
jgi:hypothetical protein